MLLPVLILLAIVGLILVPAVQRLRDVRSLPVVTWPIVALATAMPLLVAWTMLRPGTAVQAATVQAQNDTVQLVIPPHHDLLVTAILRTEDDPPPAASGAPVDTSKTAYALRVASSTWGDSFSGVLKRRGEGGDEAEDLDFDDRSSISQSGKQRAGGVGDDIQDRLNLKGEGEVEITVTNYQGAAAKALELSVVRAPPPVGVLWSLALGVAAITLYLEIRRGIEKLAGDISSLAFYGALMPQAGITPLDNIRGIAFAGLGAVLLGQGAVSAIAWVANKYVSSKEAALAPPPATPPKPGKRRR